MNFELHINQETLQTQCKDLKTQKDNLKRNMTDAMKKLSEQSEALKINEKRLAIKVSEMIGEALLDAVKMQIYHISISFVCSLLVLQKDYKELKEELHTKTDELEKLHVAAKENVSRTF